jgi:DNA primase
MRLGGTMLTDDWLTARGIHPSILKMVGVVADGDVIKYPRMSGSMRVGWKIRDLKTGKHYSDPPGIKHSDCDPLILDQDSPILVVCEGETDFLKACCLTQYDVLCVPGATAFPNSWAGWLHGYDVVYVFPDGDEAGDTLARRITELCPTAMTVRTPRGHDLCSIPEMSMDKFQHLLDTAQPLVLEKRVIRRSSFDYHGIAEQHRSKLLQLVVRDTRLKRKGGELIGLCPFHDEDTPSFMVNEQKGVYFCHGCKRGGDAVSYLREKGKTFGEAMRTLERMT